jgi:UDP-N-acetyl-D-glucosamine dehydrogenase
MLEKKIKDKSAKIGIIGLGYVGLPLAIEYTFVGYKVLGIDKDERKVENIKRGINYIDDVEEDKFSTVIKKGLFTATTSYDKVKELDVIYICVPTPFSPTKDPDISFIVSATEGIAKGLRKEQLIILKSTTFPGTTENYVQPILEKTALKVGKDFYLAFSPERIDPGNKKFNTSNTPIIVGGVTKKCTKLTQMLTETIVEKVFPVSSPRVAEMEKLLENIFRSVNIALVNELARLCDRMGNINIWEVIDAASTKPFGFMPFYPGPGIGGHCILVDPYYLSWKAKEYDFHTNFIDLAAETNEEMPFYVVRLVQRALNTHGVAFNKAKILILGAAFKKNVDDTRNSPALKVMEILQFQGVKSIDYNDPHVPKIQVNGKIYKSKPLTTKSLSRYDCAVVATDHSNYDYDMIVKNAKLIIDTRNATKNVKKFNNKIWKLGVGIGEAMPNKEEH